VGRAKVEYSLFGKLLFFLGWGRKKLRKKEKKIVDQESGIGPTLPFPFFKKKDDTCSAKGIHLIITRKN